MSIAITGVLFGLVHALPLEGFVAITTFGLVAGWLTIRTGGLEAAIALHVLNNVTFFLVDAATGRGDKWVTELNKDVTWTATAFDVVLNVLYGVIIAMLYARRK
ncbi:MAG: CPBP family intramembrane metalloprotease [Deltaproteobacteria bacterium]|nr:CPBP family intramembrane metalloprotease [Deltaproteobacteria bacterium]